MDRLTAPHPPRDASRAITTLLAGSFAFLVAMLGFNLYLPFGAWFIHPAIFGIGSALLVAGAYHCFRSKPNRLVGLLLVASGATAVCIALNAEYWSFIVDESVPIVCQVRDRVGTAVAGAHCQIIDARSGDPVGAGIADDLGFARFDARLTLRGSISWVQSVRSVHSEYVVRASADGFRLKDEPLGLQGQPIDHEVITVAILLEKAP